jgi:DNA-binding MarR family transcriptional regulator
MADLSPKGFTRATPNQSGSATAAQLQSSPLRTAGAKVATAFEAVEKLSANITVRQIAVLARAVERPGETTVASLSASLEVSKPVVTRALDRLRDLNLAHRRISTADRRVVLVDPTPFGVRLIAEAARALVSD